MIVYYNSDTSFWIEWYTHAYKNRVFSLEYLKEKLLQLESVKSEWENSRYYQSYCASVEALRIVIRRIEQ